MNLEPRGHYPDMVSGELGLLALGVLAGITNLAGVWSSILEYTSYYPLGSRDWQFYAFWGTAHLLNLSLLALGVLQFGTYGLPQLVRGGGFALVAIGSIIVFAATRDLGVEQTQGMDEGLRTDGLYRYTRNPQYVGYIPATAGYALLVDAPFVFPLCGFYLLWWFSFPLAEEPWLRERYGQEYESYAERVPRFVGRRTLWLWLGRDYGGK